MAQRGLSPGRSGEVEEAPRIALCLGDPAGIGYEVGLDAVAKLVRTRMPYRCGIMVVGDGRLVAAACEQLERKPLFEKIAEPMVPRAGQVSLLDSAAGVPENVALGMPSGGAGRAAMSALELGARCARYGIVDALVYTPLDHRSLVAAGTNINELSDFFLARLGGDGPRMDVVVAGDRGSRVWVGRVAPPAPLMDVHRHVTKDAVVAGLVLLQGIMVASGVADVRIALPSLSSHAQLSGRDCPFETEVLLPAVAQAKALGVNVTGPLAADTVFASAFAGSYSGVLSLYHDQGMIAVKSAAFNTAVLLHAGLPIPVVTTAHGSALQIAGKGVASSSPTIESIALAAELVMAGNRRPSAEREPRWAGPGPDVSRALQPPGRR